MKKIGFLREDFCWKFLSIQTEIFPREVNRGVKLTELGAKAETEPRVSALNKAKDIELKVHQLRVNLWLAQR